MSNQQKLLFSQAIISEAVRGLINPGRHGCKDDEKEEWLRKLTQTLNFLKDKSVDVSGIEPFITKEWIDKVCLYLNRKGPTFNVINDESGFFAFQYFIHEAFEICLLASKKLDPWDKERLEKENKDDLNWSHAKALEKEYIFLTQIAQAFGYSISFGTIFERHPFFFNTERERTKDNDRVKLSEIGVDVEPVASEFKDAEAFFKELKLL